jgi:glycosyltransferase involved in cell wall biosynthesis
MRLLVTTQSIDTHEPLLGFFHNWIVALAIHFERIDVICLRKGTYNLPANVHVHSLGKEGGVSRIKYVFRFYRYVWQLRNEVDAVFSHMNPHYIVLAGLLWHLKGVRMFLWRNHAKMNLKTWIGAQFAERVFYTSPLACTRRFKHAVQVPVGIDTGIFTRADGIERKKRNVLFLGRLSPVKRPELFMKAVALLDGYDVHVYGDPTHDQILSVHELTNLADGKVAFHTSVPNAQTPKLYSASDIYVNLTPEGSMDKTVLEAAACGALVLVANTSFREYLPPECVITDATSKGISHAIGVLSSLPEGTKELYRNQLRDMVEGKHSLSKLILTLVQYIYIKT